jgi:hypothetical protein
MGGSMTDEIYEVFHSKELGPMPEACKMYQIDSRRLLCLIRDMATLQCGGYSVSPEGSVDYKLRFYGREYGYRVTTTELGGVVSVRIENGDELDTSAIERQFELLDKFIALSEKSRT